MRSSSGTKTLKAGCEQRSFDRTNQRPWGQEMTESTSKSGIDGPAASGKTHRARKGAHQKVIVAAGKEQTDSGILSHRSEEGQKKETGHQSLTRI